VDEFALYDTVTAEPSTEVWAALDGAIDGVTFTSPSSVRNWLRLIESDARSERVKSQRPVVACIGPVTADEAEKRGLSVAIVPVEYTIDGLVAAIARYFMEQRNDVDRTSR
jgi:uroporphyrinogen-III synthase